MDTVNQSTPEQAIEAVDDSASPALPAASPVPLRQALPPKGACWYCDRPLDSVRRFCGKACADAFAEEAGFIR